MVVVVRMIDVIMSPDPVQTQIRMRLGIQLLSQRHVTFLVFLLIWLMNCKLNYSLLKQDSNASLALIFICPILALSHCSTNRHLLLNYKPSHRPRLWARC